MAVPHRSGDAERSKRPSYKFPPPLPFDPKVVEISITKNGNIDTNPIVDISKIPGTRPDHSGVTARIFVVEGDKSLMKSLPSWTGLPREFIDAHIQNDADLQREVEQETRNVLFASWSRLVVQDEVRYKIEQRILAKTPYKIDTVGDPWSLHINHKRYCSWPDYPRRTYNLVAASENGEKLYHAAKQCMSLYYTDAGGVFIGILLVDPIRYNRTFDIKFNFWTMERTEEEEEKVPCFLGEHGQERERGEDKDRGKENDHGEDKEHGEVGPFDRFIRALKQHNGDYISQNPREHIKMVIARLMYEDLSRVLGSMSRTLDKIELAFHDNVILQTSMPIWRRQLGGWRNTLFHQITSFRCLYKNLITKDIRDSGQPSNTATVNPGPEDHLKTRLERLGEDLERTAGRIETTFHSLMLSMSIAESERAIGEAEVVSKLTHLAFFFIPLSLVAGIFSMDINEFQGHLTWWLWVLISIVISGATYIALYWRELISAFLQLPALVMSLSVKRLSQLAVRWLRILNSVIAQIPIVLIFIIALGVLASLSVGTWKLAESSLPVGAKVAIGMFVIWAPLGALLPLYCVRQHRLRRHRPEFLFQDAFPYER